MPAILTRLRKTAPVDDRELAGYLRTFLGLKVSSRAICAGHDAPLAYLADAFFDRVGDCVVWAPRGGGKTTLAAALTLLESVFKPNCGTRILGGSSTQSKYLYDYFREFLEKSFASEVAGRIGVEKTRFVNGSEVAILTQSSRTVRGVHVPRLRLDEVEEFRADVLEAALFIPHSGPNIPARTEMLSTLHHPFGLMSGIIDDAPARQLKVYKWCLWEVIERCRDRSCSRCPLADDCQGKARRGEGFYRIDDAVAKKRLVSQESWESEMLCLRPSREGLFYRGYDEDVHVAREPLVYRSDWELYRSFDWGVNGPTVCLWVQVDGDGRVYVIDELFQSGLAISDMAANVLAYEKRKGFGQTLRSYCDPTGPGYVMEFGKAGINCTGRREDGGRINVRHEGFETVRRLLKPDENGRAGLLISPACVSTRKEFRTYHYPATRSGSAPSEEPAKVDDHAMDALRYFAMGRFHQSNWQFQK